jgi:hypothetical protein
MQHHRWCIAISRWCIAINANRRSAATVEAGGNAAPSPARHDQR